LTNESFPVMTEMINIAIKALAKRTDPLTERVNKGETLTNSETSQLIHDIFNLASILKTAAIAVDAAIEEMETQDKEIALMKTLLGLSESEKAEKHDK
jgi:hypothetical protein